MFVMRTDKPGAGNKFYNTKSKGGYSTCVKGKCKSTGRPDTSCDVLANCVGYACGRFNEIIGKMKYPSLNCNAENFIERAKSLGLEISNVPTLGGIMVWKKGNTLSGNDGAGHVEVVEKIYNSNEIYTSTSGWNNAAFWNAKRNNNNGRWGLGSGYTFRGCIVNPAVGKVIASPEEPKTTTSNKKGTITIKKGSWYVRRQPGIGYGVVKVIKGETKIDYYDIVNGWYKLSDGYIGPAAVKTKSTSTSSSYYKKCDSKYVSIVDALDSIKVDSSKANRKKIAKANNITGYVGLPSQNTKMLNLLKQGKLKKA